MVMKECKLNAYIPPIQRQLRHGQPGETSTCSSHAWASAANATKSLVDSPAETEKVSSASFPVDVASCGHSESSHPQNYSAWTLLLLLVGT